VPLSGGELGIASNTMSPGSRSIYLSTKWYPDLSSRLATIDMSRKEGGAEYPFNTVWPGPRHTSIPSDILINGTAWPQ